MNFNYEFEEDPSSGDFNAEKYVTEGEKIKVSIEGNSEIWISANSKGWLKLAKLCIEMGMRELNNGYHFHCKSDFELESNESLEISFERDDNL